MLKSFTTLEKTKIDSIAIGGFDGVHLGHQVLLSKLTSHGAMLVIHRGGVGLTPNEERCTYHDRGCFLLELSRVKMMSASSFVDFLTKEFPALKKIVVGYDFRFGKNREGDVALLKKLFKGEVFVVDEVFYHDVSIHAQTIKRLLLEAKIEEANRLLGRAYSLKGRVIKGQGIGKEQLYATLNLDTGDFFLPAEGVYATRVEIAGEFYPSVSFIGKRISTDGAFSVETHILDESFECMREEVRLFFVSFVRKNRKFKDLRDLKVQISQDIGEAKLKLARLPQPLS